MRQLVCSHADPLREFVHFRILIARKLMTNGLRLFLYFLQALQLNRLAVDLLNERDDFGTEQPFGLPRLSQKLNGIVYPGLSVDGVIGEIVPDGKVYVVSFLEQVLLQLLTLKMALPHCYGDSNERGQRRGDCG